MGKSLVSFLRHSVYSHYMQFKNETIEGSSNALRSGSKITPLRPSREYVDMR